MPRYLLLAKFEPAALAARTTVGFAAQEAQSRMLWQSVGGEVEAWFNAAAADEWDVVAVVSVPAEALFAVANVMVASGALARSDFIELRTSEEADAMIAAYPGLRLPGGGSTS